MLAGSGPRRRSSTRLASDGARAAKPDPKGFAIGVGEAVRRARQSVGWTQAELAERAGFSSNYVARLERGELGPSLFVAHRLCDTLGIEVTELLPASASNGATRRRRAL